MNKERREAVAKILATLNTAKDQLTDIAAQEREAQENKPEQLQNTDAADYLDSAESYLGDAISDLENIE